MVLIVVQPVEPIHPPPEGSGLLGKTRYKRKFPNIVHRNAPSVTFGSGKSNLLAVFFVCPKRVASKNQTYLDERQEDTQ